MLCAVAVYFISGLIVQFISMGLMLLFRLLPGISFYSRSDDLIAQYLFEALGLSIAIMFAVSVIEYIGTHYIMKRKINLL